MNGIVNQEELDTSLKSTEVQGLNNTEEYKFNELEKLRDEILYLRKNNNNLDERHLLDIQEKFMILHNALAVTCSEEKKDDMIKLYLDLYPDDEALGAEKHNSKKEMVTGITPSDYSDVFYLEFDEDGKIKGSEYTDNYKRAIGLIDESIDDANRAFAKRHSVDETSEEAFASRNESEKKSEQEEDTALSLKLGCLAVLRGFNKWWQASEGLDNFFKHFGTAWENRQEDYEDHLKRQEEKKKKEQEGRAKSKAKVKVEENADQAFKNRNIEEGAVVNQENEHIVSNEKKVDEETIRDLRFMAMKINKYYETHEREGDEIIYVEKQFIESFDDCVKNGVDSEVLKRIIYLAYPNEDFITSADKAKALNGLSATLNDARPFKKSEFPNSPRATTAEFMNKNGAKAVKFNALTDMQAKEQEVNNKQ